MQELSEACITILYSLSVNIFPKPDVHWGVEEPHTSVTLPTPDHQEQSRSHLQPAISGLYQSHYFSLSSLVDGFREHSSMTWSMLRNVTDGPTRPTSYWQAKKREKWQNLRKNEQIWYRRCLMEDNQIEVSECSPLLHCCWCLGVVCHGQCVISVSELKTNYILNGLQISCVQSAGWFT